MGVGGVLYAAMLVLLLSPPKSLTNTTSLNHWFGGFYLLLFIFDTVSSISYYAFGMELATTPTGRADLWFYNLGFGQIGTLVGAGAPAALLIFFADEHTV